ncbi:MAG: TlpA family protein disulfide reductase [Planctomycetes bacterium]|nr:TlpA family protein disulfide reductase [Planctomycetota bacterium]
MSSSIRILAVLLVVASGTPFSRAQAPAVDPRTELASIDARRLAADELLRKRYDAAADDDERARLVLAAPWNAFADEYAVFARVHAGSEVAVDAWAAAVERAALASRVDVVREALDVLEREHHASPNLGRALPAFAGATWMIGTNRYEVFLRRVATETTQRAVRGLALFALAEALLRTSERYAFDEGVENAAPRATAFADDELAQRKQQCGALCRTLARDFADTPPPRDGLPADYVKRRVEGMLFELEHLQLGMVAPDFDATDEDGASWSLAQYRGRVVLLSFWAEWCAPCMALVPTEKQLVRRFASEPFSLLGVNSDGDAATVKQVLARHGITWRQAVDRDTSGALATRWNVHAWPTLYLLDARGVIRARDVRDEAELARTIELLLAELATPRTR